MGKRQAPDPGREREREPVSKRWRGSKNAPAAQGSDEGTQNGSPAEAAAAAAAAGRAQADEAAEVGSDRDGGSSADERAGEQQEGATLNAGQHGVDSAAGDAGKGQQQFHGVRKVPRQGERCWRVRVWADAEAAALLQPGLAPSAQQKRGGQHVDVGMHRSAEAAARVHDRAAIAIYGLQAVTASLNFPAATYAGERQRYGPDLAAFLSRLSDSGKGKAKREKATKRGRKLAGPALQRARGALQKAQALNQARQAPKRAEKARAEQVEALRQADPVWAPPREPCGACPACRQPWRTDLGDCVRLQAAQQARHSEAAVVQLLARDPDLLAEVYGSQALHGSGGGAQQEAPQPARQAATNAAQQQQRGGQSPPRGQPRERREGPYDRPGSPRGSSDWGPPELEWLEPPPKKIGAHAASAARAAQAVAAQQLRQQLAAEEVMFAAALEREQMGGGPAPVAGTATPSRRRGSRGGGGSSGAAASPPAAAAAQPAGAAAHGQQQQALDGVAAQLVSTGTWLTHAAPPHDTFMHEQEDVLPTLAMLAAVCRHDGAEAPLATQAVEEVLEARQLQAELEQRQQQVLQHRQPGGGAAGDGPAARNGKQQAGGGAWAAEGASSGAEGTDAGGTDAEQGDERHCALCGGRAHGRRPELCPVLQLALAVPKPAPECPGCAHREQPGCKQCLGGSATSKGPFKRSLAHRKPWIRRVPWLDKVPPATKDLMLAAQEFGSAAVADLDAPGAAWRCTPKALLAVGLLAEQAARRELGARGLP